MDEYETPATDAVRQVGENLTAHFRWNPLRDGSNSQKADALMARVVDENGVALVGLTTATTLAAAQVYALLAIEDAIREGIED